MLVGILKRLLGRGSDADSDRLTAAMELHRHGNHREVVQTCRSLLASAPDNVDVLNLLAAALCALGESREGIACLRRVTELAPDSAPAAAMLARVLAATGDLDAAIEYYRRAAQLQASHPGAWEELARLLQALGRYDEAEECCRSGLRGCPGSTSLHHTLARALFEQGRVDDAITEFRAALALSPHMPALHSDLLRTLYYADNQDPVAVLREHRAWAERHARPLEDAAAPHSNNPDPAKRLRIGYVSPFFRKHAVTFFFEAIIQQHDRAGFEIILYADVEQPDEYSDRLRGYGSTWRSTVGMSDEDLAQLIRDDGVDILVDLTGHTPSNRLLAFARQPAPVQITSLTTGMASVDYRITDAYADPPGATEHLHSEKAMRLTPFYTAWRPPDGASEVGTLPAMQSGRITFGSFNSCYKVTPTIVALWARILHQVPLSRLMLITFNGEVAVRRVQDLFGEHGVEPDRLEFMPRMTFDEYFSSRRHVDLALDTFPFHGCTTTCDSLWMGVPVVTLAGPNYYSRIGVSMLTNAGLPPLVAQTADEYVEIACRLVADLPELARMRASLREMLLRSPITDGLRCARNLESAYRQVWLEWCQRHTA